MKKKIIREVRDVSTDALICKKPKFGTARIQKHIKKARNFHAKGIIKEISDDFRSFGLECIPEDIKGLQTSPKAEKINLTVYVTYENSILFRHWLKIRESVNMDLVYYVIYKDDTGDETFSRIYYRDFLK